MEGYPVNHVHKRLDRRVLDHLHHPLVTLLEIWVIHVRVFRPDDHEADGMLFR